MSYQTPGFVGPGNRLFADPTIGPDEQTFQVDNTSDQYYQSPYYAAHQNDLQAVPAPLRSGPMVLADVVGTQLTDAIAAAKRIVFHAVGDTGASTVTRIATQADVADVMAADIKTAGPEAPAFLFHLGDVIYNFGEAEYYYDQFYEPFRGYDRPIFAIPGNHDGAVQFGPDPRGPLTPSLMAFLRNFCATQPGRSPDSGALVRSAMNQPGAYFTLDAPLVSIVGLYTNVLEGPGVISSQGGKYKALDSTQLDWLTGELKRLKQLRTQETRAVVLACHHPPVSADAKHGGSAGQAGDIDAACQAAGFWPDIVLSGHAHLYQRFSRALGPRALPYIVAGSGGHNVSLPQGEVVNRTPLTWGEYTLERPPALAYGYLTLVVDANGQQPTLTCSFKSVQPAGADDTITVNLGTGQAS